MGDFLNKLSQCKYIVIRLFSTVNLANMIIGGGIITMPASITSGGLFLGILLCILMSMISSYTCVLLILCVEKLRIYSYHKLANRALGKFGYITVIISQFFYSFFVSVAFCILITDNLSIVIGYYYPQTIFARNRALILMLLTLLIFLPLSLFKKLTHLEHFSMLSILMVIFYMIFMIVRLVTVLPKVYINKDTYRLAYIHFPKTLAKMSFSCTIHHNLCGAYKATPKKLKKDFISMLFFAFLLVTLLNIVVFSVCFVMFNLYLKGNVFNYFCSNDNLANITRLVFAATIALTFPFQVFAAREVLLYSSVFKLQQFRLSHYIVTIVLILGIYLTGAFYENIDIVVQITGALTSVPLVFILPPLIYMKLILHSLKPSSINALLSWIIIIFGVLVLIYSTILIVQEFITDAPPILPNRFWCDMFFL